MPAKVKVIDKGWKKIGQSMQKFAKGKTAAVGIQAGEADISREGGATNVLIGVVHEFGAKGGQIPERSYMRSTFDANKSTYQTLLNKIGANVFSAKEIEGELLLLGEKYRKDIIDKIRSGIEPALADSTIEAKAGDTTPLIKTGQLINALTALIADTEVKRAIP
jgi:hypothetical protein